MEKLNLLKRGELSVITIQNPPFNFLSGEVLKEFPEVIENVKNDDAIKCVVITGTGIFSAGADVKDIWNIAQKSDKYDALRLLEQANDVLNSIENLSKPTLAVIDGLCLGGGNELAMACTARMATDESRFGQPEINLGIMPGMGGTQRLPRLVKIEPALRLLLSGTTITAKEALELGLVDKVVSKKDLLGEAKKYALHLLAVGRGQSYHGRSIREVDSFVASDAFQTLIQTKSHKSVYAIVDAVRAGCQISHTDGLKIEQKLFCEVVFTEEAKRGIAKLLKIELPEDKLQKAQTKSLEPEADFGGGNNSEELEMFREMVREFAEKEIRPRIKEMEKAGAMPRELFNQMGEMGFFAGSYPEEYGGGGLGKVAYCILFEELARVHGSSAVVAGAHTGLACGSIFIGGNEEQKQKYLKAGLSGEMMGAFALTEPEAGSDAEKIKTTATKQSGGWIINGKKQYTTNGPDADFVVVIAQTDPFLKKDGLVALIVETKWQGFKVGKIEHKLGIKASRTSELILENVFVPDENVLGKVGQAFKIFMKTLNGGRLGLAAGCVGSSKRALELSFKYASDRQQFGMPIIMNQAIQFYLAEIRANINIMEEAVYGAARKADSGKDVRLEAACVKLRCSEMNESNIRTALQIHGGTGYDDESEISRMMRDCIINTIFEGTNEIQKLLIFKEIFASGGKI